MSRTLNARPPLDLEVIEEATEVLAGGGLVVLPTDTVYGVAASLARRDAIDKIFDAKGRSREIALPVLVGSIEEARKLCKLTPVAERLAAEYWPGALTLVLERRAGIEVDLGGNPETIGVRIPDTEIVREIVSRIGPVAATSANRSGRADPTTVSAAEMALGHTIDLYLDGGDCGDAQPSTVIDARAGARLVRAGAIDPAELGIGVS